MVTNEYRNLVNKMNLYIGKELFEFENIFSKENDLISLIPEHSYIMGSKI
jgi:hypothetical protein